MRETLKQSQLKAILQHHCRWRSGLRGANLRGANLECAYLPGADLRGADFTGAYIVGADFTGADLRGAKFTTNFKKVGWFAYATFSEEQIAWAVLHPKYPKWADTLKWANVTIEAA